MGALCEKPLGEYFLLWNSGIWNRDMYVGIYFYFCIRWDNGKVHEYSTAYDILYTADSKTEVVKYLKPVSIKVNRPIGNAAIIILHRALYFLPVEA